MSRIGKKPVPVPSGVEISIDPKSRTVTVKGGKGSLSMTHRPEVSVAWDQDEKQIQVSIPEDRLGEKQVRAYWGLTRSLIANMVEGVTKGYSKRLEIHGVGWGAKQQGMKLLLNLGYCNEIEMEIPQGVDVEAKNQNIIISGMDKQAVGNFASSIRAKRKPEPYNGKGVRFAGENIMRKQGKAFGA
ncbi:MAG: 50S ribosomal protein L6 [Phycisphaerales bacterium]|nr:50S ribosomal protein L6 [Phycisphaerales bacterium]